MRTLVFLLALLSLSACTTVQSAYLTNMSAPAASARPIEAESSKLVFLGLNFDNDYAFEARESLYAQCPAGMVTGVLSTYETRSYVIFTDHVIRARGYCKESQ